MITCAQAFVQTCAEDACLECAQDAVAELMDICGGDGPDTFQPGQRSAHDHLLGYPSANLTCQLPTGEAVVETWCLQSKKCPTGACLKFPLNSLMKTAWVVPKSHP